jgi:putative ABC transport system permease protein
MNYLKRGFTSIVRQPIKSLILLGLIFILGNIIAGAISVQKAVYNTESILRRKMSPAVTLNWNETRLRALLEQNSEFIPESLSVETLEEIGALPFVKYFDYSIGATLESRTLVGVGEHQGMGATLLSAYRFYGSNNPEPLDLKEGKIKLVSGRVFNEQELANISYVVLISQSLAEANNLSVGSKIACAMNVIDMEANDGFKTVASQNNEFEVIGLFEPVNEPRPRKSYNGTDSDYIDSLMENAIYAPNKALYEIVVYQFDEFAKMGFDFANLKDYTPLYILKDPLEFEQFKENTAALMPDYYKVIGSADNFDTVTVPMKSLQNIAVGVLYTAIVATVIILGLLVILFLRDRRHEIGLYLSLGERKVKIAAQIALEVIAVAVVALTLSLVSGNSLSGAVSERMLINQIAEEQARSGNPVDLANFEITIRGYQLNMDSEDILKSYAVSLDLLTILLFYGIALGTISVSTFIPILYSMRLNPKTILT